MDETMLARLEARSRIFRALGHPTRLFVVEELAKGERCVCELRDLVGADISTVSKHLSVLKSAGLVADEKRGLMVYYRLRMQCILNTLTCIDTVLETGAREQLALVCRS